MTRTRIQMMGFNSLMRLLQQTPRKVSGPIARSGVRGAAAVMQKYVTAEVPVDEAILKKSQGNKVKTFKSSASAWVGASVEKMKTLQSPTHVQPRPTNIDYLANYGHVAGVSAHPLAPPPGTFVPGAHYMEAAARKGMNHTRAKMGELIRKGLIRALVRGKL